MTAPAAPSTGRRAGLGAAAVLAGFLLLAPPLFLLGPFALLTLLARPRTSRELFWLALSAAGVSATLAAQATLGPAVIRTAGIALSVAFVVFLYRAREGEEVPRAFAAVLVAAAVVAVWAVVQGITWPGIEQGFTEMLRKSYQTMQEVAGSDPESRKDAEEFVRPFIEAAPGIARVMPGLLALEGLAGALLAWSWHHRISARPLGPPPGRFRDFRFNDHLVWGAIFTLGLLLVPLPPPGPAAAANLLIVWAGLYAARGLAIAATVLAPAPALLKLFVFALAFLLIPIVLGACLALGLADTWLDIRGRLAPPAPGGA